MRVPVLINCRDRLDCLRELVGWLEANGLDEIYILDNDSAYEPLIAWYNTTPHKVLRLGRNYGHLAPWLAPGVFESIGERPVVVTDPDVVPDERCPGDVIERFASLLDRYPRVGKVGFGLRIDDLPTHYPHRDRVVAWERRFWQRPLERHVYVAPIDTTFALHRPGAKRGGESLRTGFPYVARHTSWYLDFERLPPDEAFYQLRADETAYTTHTSNWTRRQLPQELEELIDTETAWSFQGTYRAARQRLAWTLRNRRATKRRLAQSDRPMEAQRMSRSP